MIRFVFKLVLCLLIAFGAAFGLLAMRSGDAAYTVFEWITPARFQQHDPLIRAIAAEHELDPMLVKAVVWRESRFDPQKHGTAGERGLMQVSEKAAMEWAQENKVENFQVEDLLDAKTNLQAGSWYLQRAYKHWDKQEDPLPFALAEYNAGASRAQRWAGSSGDTVITSKDFLQKIEFPGTRKYVDSIIDRYQFYKRRGKM